MVETGRCDFGLQHAACPLVVLQYATFGVAHTVVQEWHNLPLAVNRPLAAQIVGELACTHASHVADFVETGAGVCPDIGAALPCLMSVAVVVANGDYMVVSFVGALLQTVLNLHVLWSEVAIDEGGSHGVGVRARERHVSVEETVPDGYLTMACISHKPCSIAIIGCRDVG